MEPYRAAPRREDTVKQTQIVRRPRRRGGPEEPVDLPVLAVSDTSAATRVLAAIEAALRD